MLKSLHYLTTRAMHFVIALVALFAVGLTASAEYYSINLQRDGATEFRQGELRVTSTKTATSTGIVINGTQTRINIDGPNGLKGIGRVIITPAEGTPASVLRNLVKASSMAIAASDDVTVTNDNKIVYTPTDPEENLELYLRAGTSIFGLGGPEVTIERIEVYLGYYTHEPDTYEFTDPYRTASCSFGGGTTYVSQQGNAWKTISRSAGYEVALQPGDYVRQGSDNVVLKLVGGEGRVIRSANTLRIATGSTFDLFAPAGYAIQSVRFKGEGAEGINGVGGNTHGNLDRFWDAPDGQFEESYRFTYDNVEGYTDESADFVCDQIIVTCVSLGTKPDPHFNVNDDQLWPRSHAEAFLSEPIWDGQRSFWLTVHPAAGVTFTSAAEVPAVTMTFADGTTYEPRVMGAVDEEGNAVFTIFVDQLLTRIPRVATLNFPEGAICAGPQYSSEFSTTLHLRPATIYDYVSVAAAFPSANDYEQYGYTDFNINNKYTHGVVDSFRFFFDGYYNEDWALQWTYDEPLDPKDLTFLDEENNELPIARVEIATNDAGESYLLVTPATPITENNLGRYRLVIPEAVVTTKNGYTNRRYVAGYNFYVEDNEVLKMLPGKNSTVRSLDQLVYYLPSGRSLTPTAETIDVEYAFGDGFEHLTGTVSVDEQGRGIVKFDRTFTADEATEFVMLSVNPKPFTVDGKQPGYTSLNCTIDSNLSTFSHGYTSPTWDRAVEIGFFDRDSEVYNGQRGFFISFRGLNYNLTDAQGVDLKEGDRIWPEGSAPQTQGFQFTFQGADLNDMSSWKWQDAVLLFPDRDTYGIFVPVADIFPGKYHLVIPEGLINGRQVFNNSHAVNETIDLIWEVVNCAEDGAFRIVYPQMDATYKSIDKVIVECNADVTAVARTYIEDFRENVNMLVVYFDSNAPGNAKNVLEVQTNAATATLNDKGQVVYTFDSPLTFDPAKNGDNPAYVALAVDPGWIYNNMGLCNREIQVASFVDPTIEYRQARYTYPDCSGVHPLSDYAYEAYRLGVHFGNDNDIAFDEDNIKYYEHPDNHWNCGAILYDSEIGFPEGYSFTEVKTGADLTARTTVQVGLSSKWMLYFSAGTDLQPGTYRIHFPAGAIRFVDGKYNDEFEYTWTLVGTIPEKMISVVYPSEYNHGPFDHLEIALNADTYVPTIIPVADEINNLWLAQYADYEGQQMTTLCADGQHAKLSVNEQGNLIVQLDHMIDNAGMVNVEVAPSTFFDQNGNANPNLQLSFAPRCYELGWPNVSNNDLIKNLAEFQITVWDGGREHPLDFAPVADDYAINFSVELYDDDYKFKENVDLGSYTGCIASIAKNDEGRNVITVSVPDVVQGRIAELTGYCELLVTLPGYNPDLNAAPTMAIRTTGGLPNREARYDFRIKPDLTYNCFFSMIDMPEGVTILFDGSPIGYNENGFHIEECDEPITPDRFSFEGLPEGIECKITIEGGDVSAKGILDFTRYAKIESYPFMNNTVEQSEFATSPSFSFIFDREVDDAAFDSDYVKERISGWCDYPFNSYNGGWSGAGSVWFGFGFDTWSNPDTTFPAGDYRVSIPARIFQFKDGSWNPAINYDFTVTAGTTFRIASHAVTYYTDNGLAFQKPNTTGTTNPFCNIALYFDGQTVKADDFEFSYDTTSKYIDVNVLDPNTGSYDPKRAKVILNYDAEKEQQVLVLRLDDLLLPPYAMVSIPEGALTTRDGRTNKQYDMWFNIMEEGHKTLMLYVDGELSYDASISYQVPGTAETFYAASYHDVDAQNWTNIQIVGPSYLIISDEDYDDELNRVNLWLATDPAKALSGVTAKATADCQGGLRDAVVKFQKPNTKVGALPITITPDADLIRERIEWSEGFKLFFTMTPATGRPRDVTVTTDIAYVTTEVDADSKQLILHFFDAEGNDFCPFDDLKKKPTYLTIPVEKLFKSSALWTSSSKTVTVELTYSDVEIVTDNTAYDEVANTTTTGKIGSLSDIILGHRRNGARTNDLDGNGDISIGDIVRLIKRAQ